MLRNPIQAILPNFTLLTHNDSTMLAAIDKTEFRLSKAVNLSLTRKVAFRSMAEFLSHQHMTEAETMTEEVDFNWPDVYRSPLAMVSIVLSIIALGFTVTLSFKFRALSMLVLGARATAAAPTFLNFSRRPL